MHGPVVCIYIYDVKARNGEKMVSICRYQRAKKNTHKKREAAAAKESRRHSFFPPLSVAPFVTSWTFNQRISTSLFFFFLTSGSLAFPVSRRCFFFRTFPSPSCQKFSSRAIFLLPPPLPLNIKRNCLVLIPIYKHAHAIYRPIFLDSTSSCLWRK